MDTALTKGQEAQIRCTVEITDIEEALLASLMFNYSIACPKCSFTTDPWLEPELQRLEPRMFWRDRNGWVFAAIRALREQGQRVDFLSVNYVIKRLSPEKHEAIGGGGYFVDLVERHKEFSMDIAHTMHWANIVYKSWLERGGKPQPSKNKPRRTGGIKRTVEAFEIADEQA